MKNRVDYFNITTLVRPNKHSLDEAPFDASAYYDWDYDNEFLEDIHELTYGETSE
jgi:hypothetical protein